jgi:hypothetical protein
MRRRVHGLVLLMLASAGLASAQTPDLTLGVATPAAEFAAAVTMQDPRDVNSRPLCEQYSLPCASGKEFGDVGWSLSAGYSLTENLAVVGEVAAFENTWLPARQSRTFVNQAHSLTAGPRFASRFLHTGGASPNDTRVFVQLLAGVQVSDLATPGFAIRPGAGLDISTRTGLIVRLGLDYLLTSATGRDLSGSRFLVGLVFGAGAK